jgi:Transposase DDE domain group 1
LAKGYSGKRAAAYARRIHAADWLEIEPGRRWLAWSPRQLLFSRPTRTVAVRWLTPQQQWKHALYITTLSELSLTEIADLYDERGKAEVEIQADKSGLFLARRRKHSFVAQEMLILLNDWAHNLLAWFHADILQYTPFANFAPKRIIRDLFTIPAQAVIVDGQLVELQLKQSHPYAADMADCLTKLWLLPTSSCPISQN